MNTALAKRRLSRDVRQAWRAWWPLRARWRSCWPGPSWCSMASSRLAACWALCARRPAFSGRSIPARQPAMQLQQLRGYMARIEDVLDSRASAGARPAAGSGRCRPHRDRARQLPLRPEAASVLDDVSLRSSQASGGLVAHRARASPRWRG